MDPATAHNFRELGLNSKTFVLYFNTEVLLYGKYENRTQRSRHLLSIFYSRDIVPPRAQLFPQ